MTKIFYYYDYHFVTLRVYKLELLPIVMGKVHKLPLWNEKDCLVIDASYGFYEGFYYYPPLKANQCQKTVQTGMSNSTSNQLTVRLF